LISLPFSPRQTLPLHQVSILLCSIEDHTSHGPFCCAYLFLPYKVPEKVEDLSSSEEVGKQHPPLPQPTSSEPTAVPDVSEPETPSTQPIVPPPTTETEATTSPGEAAAAAVAAVDPDNSGAGTQVAEDQFIPTPEWVESWRSSLPIGTTNPPVFF